ncbi:MAG: hypothetical protein HYV96_02925 [Opitutae bacterium]|nr:hypothetical protein [Opitutae bacterium]
MSASRELGPPWGVGLGCGLECGAAGGKLSGVLAEFKQVKQEASGGRRRWFEDEAMELIVWYRGDGAVDGFQLCYPGADRRERALTWRTVGGFSHALVDSGDTRPDKNLTPVLTPDGVVPWAKIETEFGARAAELEPELREFVAGHLRRRNE